ncbi:MAG: SLC13 family permease [Dokdonella sp.]
MGIELWVTLAVLVGAVILFVTEKLPVDVVALLVLSSLLVFGVLTPAQALSGFSSPATLTVAAMFVLSAGLQTSGALRGLGNALARIRWGWLFGLVMMGLVALVSAFINNTAAVAVMLPIVIAATVQNGKPPSKFLIPLSFAAQFGGVCTLVGTSTNLLVDSLSRQSGHAGFELFEFTELGVIFVAVGIAYLMLVGRFLLPDLGVPDQDDADRRGRYMVELHVPEKSPMTNQAASEVLRAQTNDVTLLEIFRDGVAVPSSWTAIALAGDRLLLRGDFHEIERVRRKLKLAFDPVARELAGDPAAARVHVEAMVAPNSRLVSKTIAGVRFGHTYRCRVHGLSRRRLFANQPLDQIPLAVGDVMLLDAAEKTVAALRSDPALVVLGQRLQPRVDVRRAVVSALILASVITVAGLGWLPIVASALLGCAALVVLRCLTSEEAYAAIDGRVILLLAGVLPLGIALEVSGGADWVAARTVGVMGGYGPLATLAVLYLLTAVMTEVMSNNAAAVLVVPIALATADTMGVDAKPFLVAVAFAASTSFATPVGYQTNTMVYSVGGYRFVDFLKIGVPLNLIFWAMAVALIPRYFPF